MHSRKAQPGNRYEVFDDSNQMIGWYRKYPYGQGWIVRVAGVPFQRGANGRVPYPGLASTKAKAEAIIIETAAKFARRDAR